MSSIPRAGTLAVGVATTVALAFALAWAPLGAVLVVVVAGALSGMWLAITRHVQLAERASRELLPPRQATARSLDAAELSRVVEGLSVGTIVLDDSGTVAVMNRAASKLLGTHDELGRSLLELVRVPALDELCGRKGGSAEFEIPATGRRVAALVHSSPSGLLIELSDITERHRLETIRRDFVANVSHELRTPVAVISANAETLQDGALGDPESAGKLVGAIARNADRLGQIIDGLLDLSRLEAGRYRLDMDSIDVASTTARAIEGLERMSASRQAHIAVTIDGPVRVQADATALQQVLVNLISNALIHSPAGAQVTVSARKQSDRVVIEVADTGPGIPPAQKERVFERFYRLDPGRDRASGGTGLGLSIVRHLVAAMNGQVGVRDNQPRGSVFWVELAIGAEA